MIQEYTVPSKSTGKQIRLCRLIGTAYKSYIVYEENREINRFHTFKEAYHAYNEAAC